jgi:hypothetical protein
MYSIIMMVALLPFCINWMYRWSTSVLIFALHFCCDKYSQLLCHIISRYTYLSEVHILF